MGQRRLLGHRHHQGGLAGLGDVGRPKDTAYLVPQYYGKPLDYAQLPQDARVYETIAKADTVGLFQIESRAQMSALPRTKPKCFADLSMQVAIIRPGPVTVNSSTLISSGD
jgi:error-prone DNA polymerase